MEVGRGGCLLWTSTPLVELRGGLIRLSDMWHCGLQGLGMSWGCRALLWASGISKKRRNGAMFLVHMLNIFRSCSLTLEYRKKLWPSTTEETGQCTSYEMAVQVSSWPHQQSLLNISWTCKEKKEYDNMKCRDWLQWLPHCQNHDTT